LITKEAGSESESECKCQQGYFRTDALTGNICKKCALTHTTNIDNGEAQSILDCNVCAKGYTSVNCSLCDHGFIKNTTTGMCDSCPVGFFNNHVDENACFQCISSDPLLFNNRAVKSDLTNSCGADGMSQCPCYGYYNTDFDNSNGFRQRCDYALSTLKIPGGATHIYSPPTIPTRITIDFGLKRQIGSVKVKYDFRTGGIQNSRRWVYILAGGWCGIPRISIGEEPRILSKKCRCPRDDEVFLNRSVLLGNDYVDLEPQCTIPTAELFWKGTINPIGELMSSSSHMHVKGMNSSYSEEDVTICWQGRLDEYQEYDIKMKKGCAGRYLFFQNREDGNMWIEDLKVYGIEDTTHEMREPPSRRLLDIQFQGICQSRNSNTTACPGLCIAPMGYQVGNNLQNLEKCPLGMYSYGTGNTCHCKIGQQKSEAGNGEMLCTPCPEGTYGANDIGIDSKSLCVECPVGKYSAEIGKSSITTCKNCGNGKYNPRTGGTSSAACVSCESGKFHRKTGISDPEKCHKCSCR